ncbi:MAG: hypothetical protein ACYS0H_12795 [Planctomycetota bacterium]|jgi:hypothetical protein
MKQSGITRLFILVCIAVLFASYGVGLGVKQIRFAGAETEASPAADTGKPADKPESDGEEVVAKEGDASESSEEVAAEPSAEPGEEVAARPERPEGRRGMRGGGMMGEGMRERFQNMSEEERQEAFAQMRERMGSRGGRGGGPFTQLSEEDRDSFRAEMEELGARAGEMSDEEREQARTEIFEKYGIPTGGGGGGRRRGGGGGGAPPPKGRACFVPETPVWVDGKLVQIAKVTASQTIGRQAGGTFSLEQVQEHDGTFECRDIVLDSGNTIGVVDAHCFMLDSGQWIAAQNLTSGLRLKTLTGTVGIKSVTRRAVAYTGKVYNLKVKNSDRYLVGKDVVIVRDY